MVSEEKKVLDRAIFRVVQFGAHDDMLHENDRPSECKLLLEGWASRYMVLEDGRRQIVAIHIAGDFVNLQSFPLKKMDHSVGTLTTCTIALVPHDAVREITANHPHLTRLLWLSTVIDAAITRRWLLNVGRKSAHGSMVHLFCELYTRLKIVGFAEDHTFRVPVTQTEFGDCLGLSTVHTNRVLQDLRHDELITWRGKTVRSRIGSAFNLSRNSIRPTSTLRLSRDKGGSVTGPNWAWWDEPASDWFNKRGLLMQYELPNTNYSN
jgi:CRP-like cAMP-binding protein